MSGTSWYDDFLALRAAVVRAVSLTWEHPIFRAAFVNNPLQAMYSFFGYVCPFDLGQPEPTQMSQNWNLTNNTSLQISDTWTNQSPDYDSPDIFAPGHTGGWIGIDNTINLYLPSPPQNSAEWAEALAAFNQQRPFLLSHQYPTPPQPITTNVELDVNNPLHQTFMAAADTHIQE